MIFASLLDGLMVSLILLGLYAFGTVVRQSFGGGPAAGMATLLLPPVTLWYMFMRFEHDRKLLVVSTAMLGLWTALLLAFLPKLLAS